MRAPGSISRNRPGAVRHGRSEALEHEKAWTQRQQRGGSRMRQPAGGIHNRTRLPTTALLHNPTQTHQDDLGNRPPHDASGLAPHPDTRQPGLSGKPERSVESPFAHSAKSLTHHPPTRPLLALNNSTVQRRDNTTSRWSKLSHLVERWPSPALRWLPLIGGLVLATTTRLGGSLVTRRALALTSRQPPAGQRCLASLAASVGLRRRVFSRTVLPGVASGIRAFLAATSLSASQGHHCVARFARACGLSLSLRSLARSVPGCPCACAVACPLVGEMERLVPRMRAGRVRLPLPEP